jgi:hypothetical protein
MFEENPKRLGMTVFIMATPSPSVFFVILCCWYHFVLSVSKNPKPPLKCYKKSCKGFTHLLKKLFSSDLACLLILCHAQYFSTETCHHLETKKARGKYTYQQADEVS